MAMTVSSRLPLVMLLTTLVAAWGGHPLHGQGCGASASLTVGRVTAEAPIVEVELRGHSRCEVNGFGLAIGHDPTRVEFLRAEPDDFLERHAGEDLFVLSSTTSEVDFMTLLVAFDLSLPLTVPPARIPSDTLLATLVYQVKPDAEPGDVILRNEDETFGHPPVANIFTTERLEIRPVLQSGLIRVPDLGPRFTRGDVNADGEWNISDANLIVLHLFAAGTEPPCKKAADLDDNGTVNLSDAIQLLNFLFRGGAPPAAPFIECGVDPTEDDLDCETAPVCL